MNLNFIKSKLSKNENENKVRTSHKWAWSIGAVVVALLIGWLILLFTGNNPIDFFSKWAEGNFSSLTSFAGFLEKFAWLLPLGLSVLVSFKIKIFNIGVSAQMMLGGIVGYFFAVNVDIGRSGVIFSILFPVIAGMLTAMLIGWLKVQFNINEVISSIMLNWAVFYLYKMFTNSNNFPEYFAGGNEMIPILSNNSLSGPAIGNGNFNWGFLIVILLLFIVIFAYKFLPWGLKQEIIGHNKNAAMYSGINVNRNIIKTMAISGAFAGLAGSIFYLGQTQTLSSVGTDLPSHAFSGITTSLIAFNNPTGLIFSTLMFASFENSKSTISTLIDHKIVDLIMALIVFMVSISNMFIIYRPHDKFLNWLDGKDLMKKNISNDMKDNTKTKTNLKTNFMKRNNNDKEKKKRFNLRKNTRKI